MLAIALTNVVGADDALLELASLGTGANYEIRIVKSGTDLQALQFPAAASTYPMRSPDGDLYTCHIPPTQSVQPSRAERHDTKLKSASELLAATEYSHCLVKKLDYWTYELCPGKHVRQFHQDILAAPAAEGPSIDATTSKPKLDFILGRATEGAGPALVSTPEGSLAYEQKYSTEGTAGRTARVLYECEPAGMAVGINSDIAKVVEDPPLHYTVTVGVRDPQLCELLPSTRRLMAPLNNTCIEHIDGWWTYEICLGMRLRQYHNEGGKVVQESIIGLYDWQYGEQLQKAGVGTSPAITQRYHKGSACVGPDVTHGKPREATLRFECTPAASGGAGGTGHIAAVSLLGIKEMPTCVYTITFGSPLMCQHPDVSPAKAIAVQPPATIIYCVPEDE